MPRCGTRKRWTWQGRLLHAEPVASHRHDCEQSRAVEKSAVPMLIAEAKPAAEGIQRMFCPAEVWRAMDPTLD